MLLQAVLWLLVCLVALCILSESIDTILSILWEMVATIFGGKQIDLRKTFGEWAVVTGSTDGIGKAYAIELARRNINLVLISRSMAKLENTKQEIMQVNPQVKVKIIEADFSVGKDIYHKIQLQLSDIPVGILVNNVGKMYDYPMYLDEVPEQILWDIININVGATTLMTRLVIGQMQQRRRGAIVNVSSGSDLTPLPLMTVYSATKMYIKNFSEAIRMEYSKFGIIVQHLSPFFVATKMNNYSHRINVKSLFVPDSTTYARNAIATLGKINSSTGYWAHSIQKLFVLAPPTWIKNKVALLISRILRQDHFKQKEKEKL
ncbi:inactive hydroxysteroid dehydrogenase-like protein 1 [Harpegnathos saltator]|uniref:Hydroxysteroid dehydrogenase-like protein 1 n=1 Tax=Harpegnathos saltator TaxID=610380 RepID=E2BBS8_HARSA|nr:inactive hydroxysteroid dehydrogenase-like protein 1 [Harpegnathos saltator]XP_011135891.1 inactive hydroxysteroid dehydrogenase-like protein 1 [Harpegnathos saltator]XP_011135892.1 inactive hydroxysteroid dehydrogenase-like protein 1 [Harpegnathos saltator]XP_011135893.1 inactive hydroxysteroid dehydrogenase-like protein 1 [Harpegnathos saltator]XP_025157994.1 inactive hydroxysteroid dehydrogenase-like protein 1 [Harpegnathos saltator]EFN86854.1 Hydroxysteroid dehydrogenase-like protein 1 